MRSHTFETFLFVLYLGNTTLAVACGLHAAWLIGARITLARHNVEMTGCFCADLQKKKKKKPNWAERMDQDLGSARTWTMIWTTTVNSDRFRANINPTLN